MPDDFAKFGDAVHEKRTELGLSREKLAKKAHCTGRSIQNIENRYVMKPGLDTVIGISRVLGLSIDEIYGLSR